MQQRSQTKTPAPSILFTLVGPNQVAKSDSPSPAIHLCEKKQATSVDECKNAAGERQKESGRVAMNHQYQPQRRVGELQHQPTLRNCLHPGAHIRKKLPRSRRRDNCDATARETSLFAASELPFAVPIALFMFDVRS